MSIPDEPVVRITLTDIYKQGKATQEALHTLESKMESFTTVQRQVQETLREYEIRLKKLEVQIAMQWVVIGIMLAAVTSSVSTVFFGKA